MSSWCLIRVLMCVDGCIRDFNSFLSSSVHASVCLKVQGAVIFIQESYAHGITIII